MNRDTDVYVGFPNSHCLTALNVDLLDRALTATSSDLSGISIKTADFSAHILILTMVRDTDISFV